MSEPREWWIGQTATGFDKWLTRKNSDELECRNIFFTSDGSEKCVEYIAVIERSAFDALKVERDACVKAHDENVTLMKEMQKVMALAAEELEKYKNYDLTAAVLAKDVELGGQLKKLQTENAELKRGRTIDENEFRVSDEHIENIRLKGELEQANAEIERLRTKSVIGNLEKLDGFAACNLAEPSAGDLERIYTAYRACFHELEQAKAERDKMANMHNNLFHEFTLKHGAVLQLESEADSLRNLAESYRAKLAGLASSLDKEIREVRELGGKALFQSVQRLEEARALLSEEGTDEQRRKNE